MASLDDDDVSEWARHPTTIAQAKLARDAKQSAAKALLEACSSSSDPKVAKYWALWSASSATVATLEGKKYDPSKVDA